MTVHLHQVSLEDSLLDRMAQDLLTLSVDQELAGSLILLPSSRACRALEHIILDQSGQRALLLPRIQTLTQWASGMAVELGVTGDHLPDQRLRPLALAPLLAEQPWLREHPESAVGLAKEFIALFDQLRSEGCDEILNASSGEDLLSDYGVSGAEAEVTAGDIQRVREVWQLFRQVMPRDETDDLVALASRLEDHGGTAPAAGALVLIGGFGRLTKVQCRLLKLAAQTGQGVHYYFPRAHTDLDLALGATWSAAPLPQRTDPFSPTARLLDGLNQVDCFAGLDVGQCLSPQPQPGATLKQRLAVVARPQGRITLLPCPDPETESRRVVELVVEHLNSPAHLEKPIVVATPDPVLAARILAMLKEVGVEVDNTLGSSLGSLPAGLLTRFILRAALTDLRAEPLLEVLTHPFVSLPTKQGSHQLWTLRLERMFRRSDGPQSGLAGLDRHAAERDQVVRHLFGRDDPGMAAFVGKVGESFAPLLAHRSGSRASWADYVAALRTTWQTLTSQRVLTGQDEQALSQLWDVLSRDTTDFPPVSLAEFTTALTRLLAEEMVVPRRAQDLPVMVTGLVEARLVQLEHLVLAGLRDDVFPARPPRQVLITPRLLAKLGLPGWRDHLGLEAELFLRLLQNATDITVTWPQEDVGQKFLPSPLVSRLMLALKVDSKSEKKPAAPTPPKARDTTPILQAQECFEAEMAPVSALVESRPQLCLSWSALRMWQECPYRFLLSRRFALSGEEDLRQEFSRLDYGSLVHDALQDFLTPDSPGLAALEKGNATVALESLDAAALARFSPGAEELPVRRLWLDSFRRAMPSIVKTELQRIQTWQPLLLEQEFVLPLPDLIGWTRDLCHDLDREKEEGPGAGWVEAVELGADVVLRGKIDRLDIRRKQPHHVAVLDYKTGKLPTLKKVKDLVELQVVLYAAATETGVVADSLQDVKVTEGAYYQISEEKSGPPAKPHLRGTTEEGRQLLADGSIRLIDLALAAANPAATYPVLPLDSQLGSKTALPCKYCDLRGLCRLEEMKNTLPPEVWLGLSRIIHAREGAF